MKGTIESQIESQKNPGTRRGKGEGCVFQQKRRRPDGSEYLDPVWTIQYRSGGRQHRESSGTTDFKKACKALDAKLEAIGEGVSEQPGSGRATFGEVMQVLRDDYALNDKVDSLYTLNTTRMPHLTAVFPPKTKARSISENALVQYQVRRKGEGAAPSTINKELAALHRAFVLAKRRGLVGSVPSFQRLTENNARQGFFEWEDVAKVQKHLPHYMKLIPVVMYYTGWRGGEILSRRWADVDFNAGELTLWVGEGKDRRIGRTFPLIEPLRAVLKEQRAMVDLFERTTKTKIAWLFPKPGGTQLKGFKKSWRLACEAAGVTGTPHDFRRTAVRNLELAGVPRKAAMAMIGHKTESIYQRYAIADQRMMKVGAEMMTAFFSEEDKRRKRGKLKAVK